MTVFETEYLVVGAGAAGVNSRDLGADSSSRQGHVEQKEQDVIVD